MRANHMTSIPHVHAATHYADLLREAEEQRRGIEAQAACRADPRGLAAARYRVGTAMVRVGRLVQGIAV